MKNAYQAPTAVELKNVFGPRPGVQAFMDTVLWYGHGKVRNDGIFNRRTIRGRSGPVTPRNASLHAVSRAADVGIIDPAYGDYLAEAIIRNADALGVCEVIWSRKRTTTKGTLPYKGVDPHTTHIHVGFVADWADRPNTPDLRKWIAHFLFGA